MFIVLLTFLDGTKRAYGPFRNPDKAACLHELMAEILPESEVETLQVLSLK